MKNDRWKMKTETLPNHPTTLLNALLSAEYQVLLLCLLWFLVSIPFTPGLTSINNISNIFSNLLPLLIVATGLTIVLITGGIDLSVTSVMALTSVLGAKLMSSDQGWLGGSVLAVPVGVALMLLTGALIGWLNGAAITRLELPPFIVTLTTMMFFSGLAIWLTKSKTIYNLPPAFNAIGKGSLFFIPYALLVTALIVGFCACVSQSQLCRSVGFMRADTTCVRRKFPACRSADCDAGVCLQRSLRRSRGDTLYGTIRDWFAGAGTAFVLDVIGAAVIGGASLFGGRGKIVWTIYGVFFLTLIDNTLNLAGHSHLHDMMVKGSVILLAALLDVLRTKLR